MLSATHKTDATSHRQQPIPHVLLLWVTCALSRKAGMNYNSTGAVEGAHTCAPSLGELRQGDLICDSNPACVNLHAFLIKFKQHMVASYEKQSR